MRSFWSRLTSYSLLKGRRNRSWSTSGCAQAEAPLLSACQKHMGHPLNQQLSAQQTDGVCTGKVQTSFLTKNKEVLQSLFQMASKGDGLGIHPSAAAGNSQGSAARTGWVTTAQRFSQYKKQATATNTLTLGPGSPFSPLSPCTGRGRRGQHPAGTGPTPCPQMYPRFAVRDTKLSSSCSFRLMAGVVGTAMSPSPPPRLGSPAPLA